MSELSQRFQYVWYGTCQDESCADKLFEEWDDLSSLQKNVLEISTYEGGEFLSYKPEGGIGNLTGLKCGHMYLVTTSEGGVIDFDNAYASNLSSKSGKFGVSSTCASISSAGAGGCTATGHTVVYFSEVDPVREGSGADGELGTSDDIYRHELVIKTDASGNRCVENTSDCSPLVTLTWNDGYVQDPNSYMSLDLSKYSKVPAEGDPDVVTTIPLQIGGRTVATLAVHTLPSTNTEVYFYENGTCYSGVVPTSTDTPGQVDVALSKIGSTNRDLCTFQDSRENIDGDKVVFSSYEVTPQTDYQSSNPKVSGFAVRGTLQVPPATGDSLGDTGGLILAVLDPDDNILGSVTYDNAWPKDSDGSEFANYMYFYADTGKYANRCLLGRIDIENNRCKLED